MDTRFDGGGRAPTRAWCDGADYTVPLDDLLVGRIRCCACCGAAHTAREGVWLGERPTGAWAVAYALCDRCVATRRAAMRTLDAKLRRLYDVPEDDADGHAEAWRDGVRALHGAAP
jgi:hypothetical protein